MISKISLKITCFAHEDKREFTLSGLLDSLLNGGADRLKPLILRMVNSFWISEIEMRVVLDTSV